ncbi:MAG: energy transducer TonB [Bacteroidota bacterium]
MSYFQDPTIMFFLDRGIKEHHPELLEGLNIPTLDEQKKLDKEASKDDKNANEGLVEAMGALIEQKRSKAIRNARFRALWFNVGLCISLGLLIALFEWSANDGVSKVDIELSNLDTEELMDIPISEQPPPPPPKNAPQVLEIIEVADEEEIENDISFDIEMTEDDAIADIEIVDMGEEEPEEKADEIFMVVEKQPEPEGGLAAFYAAINKNIQYPRPARKAGIQGRVYVQFVVEKDGTLTDVQLAKGIGMGCDEEAIRVIKEAGVKWAPGRQRGNPVRVRMIIPIFFKLAG